jgi:serine/threonine protein kinase
MKKMKVNNNSKDEDIKREIKLLQTLNHKYVVKYFTSFCENGFWYIIIQYINGKNFQVIADKNVENEINLEEKKNLEIFNSMFKWTIIFT